MIGDTMPGDVRLVVAGVIMQGGRVAAARRSRPPDAGRWEFPGGKVEPGETPAAALERELQEELGLQVVVGDELARTPLHHRQTLVALQCWPLGSPVAGDSHTEVCWCNAAELRSLDWLPADAVFLPQVMTALDRSCDAMPRSPEPMSDPAVD